MNEAFDNYLNKYAPNLSDIIEKQVFERKELSSAGHLFSLAQEFGADLAVLGAKGHSNTASLLLGSVTEKFIQMNDKIPTLIVR